MRSWLANGITTVAIATGIPGCASRSPSVPPPVSPVPHRNGAIVFVGGDRVGGPAYQADLYSMDPSGGSTRRLTHLNTGVRSRDDVGSR